MDLSDVTPMILTFNEVANIGRALRALSWAKKILIIDSFSTDQTLEIAQSFSNVEVKQRQFDHFAHQCNYGLSHVDTPWVLSLDADYICPSTLPSELEQLSPDSCGYAARFHYCVHGKRLRGTLYPPRTVFYLAREAKYEVDGHAHRVKVSGQVGMLTSVIDHDDRKSLASWFNAQNRYARLEAEKLLQTASLGWKDRIRKTIVLAPVLTLFYCLVRKGLILDGWSGVFYSLQRVYAELLLSLELLDRKLSASKPS